MKDKKLDTNIKALNEYFDNAVAQLPEPHRGECIALMRKAKQADKLSMPQVAKLMAEIAAKMEAIKADINE